MNQAASGRRRNPVLLCVFHALQMALFPVATITLYWRHSIGMTMQEIFLLQALFGLSIVVFEFPSGYIADRIGYRRTLVVASVLNVVGWIFYAFAETFTTILLAEIGLGLGLALISGCDSALLYESLRDVDEEESYAAWTGRMRFFGQATEGSAALMAGLLYTWAAQLPFFLQALLWSANLFVAWRLLEPRRTRPKTTQHFRAARRIVVTALVRDRKLSWIIFISVALGLASFFPVWLVPLYARDAGLAVEWIGPLWAVANYTVALGSLASDRLERRFGLRAILLLAVLLVAVGYLGLGLSHFLFGFAFYFFLTTMRGVVGPALLHQEQRLIPSADRAGFLSLNSLLFRLSFFALAPAVGAAVDVQGQHAVLLWLGPLLAALALLGVYRGNRTGALVRARSAGLDQPSTP